MALMMLMLTAAASAECYKYRDEDGHLHFTDDMSNVPVEKLPEVESFESVDKEPVRPPRRSDAAASSAKPTASPHTWDGRLRIKVEDLEKEKKKLDRTFSELQKQKAALQQKAPEKMGPSEREAYQAQVKELNARIKKYDRKREEFEKAMERMF